MTAIQRLGFLASHRGSNMQAIVQACHRGEIAAEPVLLISNNRNAIALQRAKELGLAAIALPPKAYATEQEHDAALAECLLTHQVDLVILAGYMRKIGTAMLSAFQGRIVNVHPALLPKFGGQGMFGMHVHEAVVAAGEKQTGVTVHLIDGEYDTGPILAQRAVPVYSEDSAETVAARVLTLEHELYPETIARIVSGEIELPVTRNLRTSG